VFGDIRESSKEAMFDGWLYWVIILNLLI